MVLPTVENLFNVCCLNLDVLKGVDHAFISAKEPLSVSPTNRFDEDKGCLEPLPTKF